MVRPPGEAMTGQKSFRIDVAGLVIEVAVPYEMWAEVLEERYAAFSAGAGLAWRVTVRQDASQPFDERGYTPRRARER